MEPINTTSMSTSIRTTPLKSSSAEPLSVNVVESTSVRPEFVSPKGTIDAKSGVYVVQIRNASTEMLNFQYPNKKVVAEYARSDNLIPASETKNGTSSSATVVPGNGHKSDDTASLGVKESVPVTTAGQTNSSPDTGSAKVALLGTTDND